MAEFPDLDHHQSIIKCFFAQRLMHSPSFMEVHSYFSEMLTDEVRAKTTTS